MRKTPLMHRVEARQGGPLEVVIPRLFEEGLNQGELAARLGISRATLYIWLACLGLEVRRMVVQVIHYRLGPGGEGITPDSGYNG